MSRRILHVVDVPDCPMMLQKTSEIRRRSGRGPSRLRDVNASARFAACALLALAACTSDPASAPADDSATPTTSDEQRASATTDSDSQSTEPLATVDGFVLIDAQLTDEIDPATGGPGARLDAIDAGTPARVWLSFDDAAAAAGKDSLFVSFVRVDSGADTELFRTSFRLPQPTGQQNVALGASETDVAGSYRALIEFNEVLLHVIEFEVR